MEGLDQQNENPREIPTKKKWFKRLGWGAFLFFFIKGLVWIVIIFGAGQFMGC